MSLWTISTAAIQRTGRPDYGIPRGDQSNLSPLQNKKQCDIEQIRNYMDKWDMLDFDDKRAVVDQLITVIKATQDSVEITWKI